MSLSTTEISGLRTELVHYNDQILDLTKFAVTATSALIGFGLGIEDINAKSQNFFQTIP